jgi:tRNA (mo5U34)-methyltransferase
MTPEAEIEGIGEELQAAGKGSRWEQFRMPVELTGKSFLDVGCWEGMHCAEAVRRDASQVVGLDLCTSDDLAANVDRYGFDFLQMDVFSEKWLELGEFDVVLCSGVLYHVENVMSLLFRLRKVVSELLVLETGITRLQPDKPMMIFHGGGEGTNNPSNWWSPNKLCLEQMLMTAGFEGISTVWEEERHEHYSRTCVHAVPTSHLDHARILPRKERTMSLHGGNRGGGKKQREANSP